MKIFNSFYCNEITFTLLSKFLSNLINELNNLKTVKEYDDNGNIKMNGSKVYTYDNTIKDRLVSVNGKSVLYSDTAWQMSHYDSRQYSYEDNLLKSINYSDSYGGEYFLFEYNELGLRKKKTASYRYNDDRDSEDTVTRYYYDGSLLVCEEKDGLRLDFLYDENNMLYGVLKNRTDKFYYIRDILGNILGLIDSNGNIVVKYSYDAYGKVIVSLSLNDISYQNPFRYKGYYYDDESGLYYCGSRYYSPEFCRWISPDSIDYLEPSSINGLNLYYYCYNNPIMYYDPSGHFWDVFFRCFINWMESI